MEKKIPTFEEALKRLEEIVKSMESSEVALDKSLAMFEEGVSLVKICTEALDRAEQKVKMLTDGQRADFANTLDFFRLLGGNL